MIDLLVYTLTLGLELTVVFCLYWALGGGRRGAEAVIPRRPAALGGDALFHPSPLGTLMVALWC